MEALFWVLGGAAVIFWLIWNWGKNVGLSEGRREERATKAQLNGHVEQLEDKIEKMTKQHTLERAALESALRQSNRHRDALRPAASILSQIRTSAPSWHYDPDRFLLLGPGQLREYQAWASRASVVWYGIERLSGPARVALEQAYLAALDGTAEPTAPLVVAALDIAKSRPTQLDEYNLFDFRADQFDELAQWFEHLAGLSASYVARVADIERGEEQLRRNAETRDASAPSNAGSD